MQIWFGNEKTFQMAAYPTRQPVTQGLDSLWPYYFLSLLRFSSHHPVEVLHAQLVSSRLRMLLNSSVMPAGYQLLLFDTQQIEY